MVVILEIHLTTLIVQSVLQLFPPSHCSVLFMMPSPQYGGSIVLFSSQMIIISDGSSLFHRFSPSISRYDLFVIGVPCGTLLSSVSVRTILPVPHGRRSPIVQRYPSIHQAPHH